jgi:hypothetical protein
LIHTLSVFLDQLELFRRCPTLRAALRRGHPRMNVATDQASADDPHKGSDVGNVILADRSADEKGPRTYGVLL